MEHYKRRCMEVVTEERSVFSLQSFSKTLFSPCCLQCPGCTIMLSMAISLAKSDPLTPSKTT